MLLKLYIVRSYRPDARGAFLGHAATKKLHVFTASAAFHIPQHTTSIEWRQTQLEQLVVGMQTCWKYTPLASLTHLNASNAKS